MPVDISLPWQVLHGDQRDVLATLPDACAGAVITDPPYAEETHEGAKSSAGNVLIDFAPIAFPELRAALGECGRLSRRWVIATVDWRHCARLADEPPAGLRFVRFGAWVKPNGRPQFTGDRPGQGWEAIAFLHREDTRLSWNGGGRSSVFIENKENGDHPTQKPLRLLCDLVSLFTERGDLVIDPWCGSGTTGVAALRNGCRFLGVELDAEYAALARARVGAEAAQGVLPLGV